MKLSAIEPSSTGQDLRTFTCLACRRVQRHLIESAVTEAWLEPVHAIKVKRANAITHDIRDGCMISKPAK
jgi:hypothetical protein